MKHLFLAILVVFTIGFRAEAQKSFHYSATTKPVWGNGQREINITVDITLDSLKKEIINSYDAHYGIYFSYDINFFENGKELPSTYVYSFYTLRFNVLSGSQNTDHGLKPEIQNSGYSGSGLAHNNQVLHDPENASLESLSCNVVELSIGGPGLSNRTVSLDANSTLPIELITFDAVKQERQVELSWSTASELNNDYFTIERSADGMTWENVQTILGAGNSTRVLDYSWIDNSSYAGTSYYRLKQTDYDGTTKSFNIVSVEQDEVEELQVYPNPVLHTSSLLGVDGNKPVRIHNAVGVDVTGNVNISISPSKKTLLDMSQLPKGMYYVVNGDKSIRLLKQ